MYPDPKTHELTPNTKAQIRADIESGNKDIYKLAEKFGCSASQIAGIKSHLTKEKVKPRH